MVEKAEKITFSGQTKNFEDNKTDKKICEIREVWFLR